jgi:homoserine O-acetyltransferase
VAGTLDPQRANAVLFPTWFAGTTEELFRSGVTDVVDTDRFCLIAVDALGNGVSSSPSNAPPGAPFPEISVGDMVEAQRRLLSETLGIERLHAVVGVSMGGMQVFEWITALPDFAACAVSIVGSPRLAAHDRLLWATELEAIEVLRAAGASDARVMGLVGMIHRLAVFTPGYHAREVPAGSWPDLVRDAKQVLSGKQPDDWAAQLRAMLRHDVGQRFDGSLERAAAAVHARFLNVVGTRDHMVTPEPALAFAELLGAPSLVLDSDCGHVAFRCEAERIKEAVRAFLAAELTTHEH